MSGFLSSISISENPLEHARLKRLSAGLPLLDLTSTNPTSHGFLFPSESLASEVATYFRSRRYTPDPKGLRSARETISGYYSRRNPSIAISPEQIFITASTSESYSLLFSLLAEPGDSILAPNPSYPLFDHLADHHRVELVHYQVREVNRAVNSKRWEIESLEGLQGSRTRAAIIVSPHNPTGLIYRTPSAFTCPLICDEVFSTLTAIPNDAPPIGTIHPDLPVFHLSGISKLFALPDLKVGWIALNEAAYDQFGSRLEILNDTFLSANQLSQSLLPRIFEVGEDFANEMRSEIFSRAARISALLDGKCGLVCSVPEGGASLAITIPREIDDQELAIELIDQGILLHPGYLYGLDSHVVISLIPEMQYLESGVHALLNAVNR